MMVVGTIGMVGCTNDNNTMDENATVPVVTDSQVADMPAVNAEERFPEPGAGTITSSTETPLERQNQALYKSKDGKTITAIYYFDKDKNGVVVLQNGVTDDITLKQIKEEMPSNTASYTDGKINWMATSSYAIMDVGNEQTEYSLVSMKQ